MDTEFDIDEYVKNFNKLYTLTTKEKVALAIISVAGGIACGTHTYFQMKKLGMLTHRQ